MEPIDLIKTRRSIRKFKQVEISDEHIGKILDCAMHAPSAMNSQPWHFIVVKEKLEKIAEIHPYAQMAKDSSLAIIVCADPSLEYSKGKFPQDLSAATQNILLAAHSFGLGAVWCAIYPDEKRQHDFRELFELPNEIIPFSVIPMGLPDEKPVAEKRFKKERIHYERW